MIVLNNQNKLSGKLTKAGKQCVTKTSMVRKSDKPGVSPNTLWFGFPRQLFHSVQVLCVGLDHLGGPLPPLGPVLAHLGPISHDHHLPASLSSLKSVTNSV